jgi:hypothetical protein
MAFLGDSAVTIGKEEVKRVAGWLDEVASADRRLLSTFEAQKGTVIPLALGGTRTEVRIVGVQGDRVRIETKKGVGWATGELAVSQMAPDEQYARLKENLSPEALGIWAGS